MKMTMTKADRNDSERMKEGEKSEKSRQTNGERMRNEDEIFIRLSVGLMTRTIMISDKSEIRRSGMK
jgi:hypothetical protein